MNLAFCTLENSQVVRSGCTAGPGSVGRAQRNNKTQKQDPQNAIGRHNHSKARRICRPQSGLCKTYSHQNTRSSKPPLHSFQRNADIGKPLKCICYNRVLILNGQRGRLTEARDGRVQALLPSHREAQETN